MDEKKDYKSGFVALIGRPNVGKSTLLNFLVGQKVAIMSPQPQATRNKISGIYTDDQEQIVFIDTPGIHKPKNKLDDFMDKSSYSALDEVDVVLFMVEPEPAGKGDQYIAELLKKIKKPVFLVINKIDKVHPDKLLSIIDSYKNLGDFAEIVPISASQGNCQVSARRSAILWCRPIDWSSRIFYCGWINSRASFEAHSWRSPTCNGRGSWPNAGSWRW